MRTPALDSRTEPLHLPQIPSSPVRHRHPPRCPNPNPRAQHVLLPSRTSVPGKSCCLRLGNLVGICLPPSRTPPNSKPRSTSPQATPNSLQPGLAASTLTPYNPTSAHQLERPVENTHQMSLPCVKPFGDSSPHPLSWPRDPRASSSCLSPTLAISALRSLTRPQSQWHSFSSSASLAIRCLRDLALIALCPEGRPLGLQLAMAAPSHLPKLGSAVTAQPSLPPIASRLTALSVTFLAIIANVQSPCLCVHLFVVSLLYWMGRP